MKRFLTLAMLAALPLATACAQTPSVDDVRDEAQAIITALTEQRNSANNQAANAVAQLAIVNKRLADAQKKVDELQKRIDAPQSAPPVGDEPLMPLRKPQDVVPK